MQAKSILTSKTFWGNLIALVALGLQVQFGWVVTVEYQAGALTVINVALRFITKQPVTLV